MKETSNNLLFSSVQRSLSCADADEEWLQREKGIFVAHDESFAQFICNLVEIEKQN